MNKRTFEDILAEQGKLIYTNVGDSMYPLIKPRDLLVIETTSFPLQKYDIPLYKRDSGQYVLHRIVKIKNGAYLICGDNRFFLESGITDRHVLGVLTGLVRDDKEISLDNSKYRIYARLLPIRRFFLRLQYTVKKVFQHFFRSK